MASVAAPTVSRTELTPRLKTYLEHKIANTLFKDLRLEEKSAFSTRCLNDLVEHVAAQTEEGANLNAACNKAMDNLERWIQAKPEEALLLQRGEIGVKTALTLQEEYLAACQVRRATGVDAGKTITFHHHRMRHATQAHSTTLEDSDDAQVWSKTLSTTPVQELQQYASAMGVIAGRLWVQQGYDWTAKHCLSELRGFGAQRSLRRAARKWYYDTTGNSMPRDKDVEQQILANM
eukprot:16491-Heterococcus_DN1.PRE.1